jgi:replicative DNA helicase
LNSTPHAIDRTRVRFVPGPVAGKLPPHDLEAEACVLSACLLKRAAIDPLIGVMEPEHFYSEANGRIFEAIVALVKTGSPIDATTVAAWLRDRERLPQVGGTAYIAQIIDSTPAIANVMTHAAIVIQKARRRAIIAETQLITAEGYGDVGDEEEWITATEKRLGAIIEKGGPAKSESEMLAGPMYRVFHKYLDANARPQEELVTTGFPDLDRFLALEPGTLVTVGARSGRGKSSMATQMAIHVAQRWGDALYFSSEMPSEQLALRAACLEARVDSKRVRRGQCTPDEAGRLLDAYNRLKDCSTWLNDKSGLDILSVSAVARREVKRIQQRTGRKVRAIFIDYLQRIKAGKAAPHGASREQQVAAIAFQAKELAMELRTCVVVPAQLNADADKRDDERPRVSDLRESKNIENESDAVVLIHNPHYLARVEDENADLSAPEACEIIIGKGRNDGNGMVPLWFTPIWSRFDSMTEADKVEQRRLRDYAREKGGKRR